MNDEGGTSGSFASRKLLHGQPEIVINKGKVFGAAVVELVEGGGEGDEWSS